MKKIIKFQITSDFAFFKDNLGMRGNFSYPVIHKPAVLGILGAICGYKGFLDYKKDTNIEYLEKLSNLKVGIKTHSLNNENVEIITNDSTLLGITSDRQKTIQNKDIVLSNQKYDIYLSFPKEKEDLYKEILERLSNREFHYQPYLGRTSFLATIGNVEEIDIVDKIQTNKEDCIFMETVFKNKYLIDLEEEELDKDDYKDTMVGGNFRLPTKSNMNNAVYEEIEDFTCYQYIYKESFDDEGFLSLKNKENIFVF